MRKKVFEADYSEEKGRITRKTILSVIMLILLLVVYFGSVYQRLLRTGTMLFLLVAVALGVYLAATVIEIYTAVHVLKRSIREVYFTEDSVIINDDVYPLGLEQGTGFWMMKRIKGYLDFFDITGIDLVVQSEDRNGKARINSYWTGSSRSEYCNLKREELFRMLGENIAERTRGIEKGLDVFLMERTLSVKISRDDLLKRQMVYSGALLVVSVLMFSINLFFSFQAAERLLIYLCSFIVFWKALSDLVSFLINCRKLVSFVELTKDRLKIDDDEYLLSEGPSFEFYGIGRADPGLKVENAIELRKPNSYLECGYYINARTGDITRNYWAGPLLDSKASTLLSIMKFASKLSEKGEEPSPEVTQG